MRRTLVALTLVLCAFAVPASGQDAPRTPLKASLAACVTGPSEDERFAVFTASMPAYRGTRRMAMRFDLFMRPHGERAWEHVRALGGWNRSQAGKEALVWTKRVERLQQAADYRVAVRFRWYQVGTARRGDRVRRSPVCTQPDQRPDLEIAAVDVQPGPDPQTQRYVVTVANTGRTSAEAFSVVAWRGAEPVGQRRIEVLPAGERATVELVGPACAAGSALLVRADPTRAVDESDESDNRFERDC